MTERIPNMVVATEAGDIFDLPGYKMALWDGASIRLPELNELIPLPEGSDMFLLPKRVPLGFTGKRNHLIEYEESEDTGPVQAVCAFLAPAYLRLAHPAYRELDEAPLLPLFAYAPLGWMDGQFWTAAMRIDEDHRQDPALFDIRVIEQKVQAERSLLPGNTLLKQLERCALEYHCRAAQNYFLKRWEAPLPTSPACNARCVGCISKQEGDLPSTQERLEVSPKAADVAAVALNHFKRVKRPVASFGQGCEGEPLLVAPILKEAVRLVRQETREGTLNLNTNASRPEDVDELFKLGLNSIRVSMNSPREHLYNAYHRPQGYTFEDVLESMRRAKAHKGFISLNYLVFPGVSDRPAEIEALDRLLEEFSVDMIQWRNLNIDPITYLDLIGYGDGSDNEHPVGMMRMLEHVRQKHPGIRHGYFNPFLGSDKA